MTEEEAKTKWCPMSRYLHNTGSMGNRWKQEPLDGEPYALNPVACRCIASDCMMWRWIVTPADAERATSNPLYVESGHCGLAGKP